MATFWVSKSGNDANACFDSATEPNLATQSKLTITAGIACLSAGDTLIVKDGTYAERLDIFNKLGTSTSPITIKAQNSKLVTVSGGPGWVVAFALNAVNGSQYIILDGFVLDAASIGEGDAVSIDNGAPSQPSRNITIQNCEIKNAPGQGILTQDFNTGGNVFKNNKVHDNGLAAAQQAHGIYDQGHNDLIERNECYNNGSYGIQIQNANDVIARYNILRNNGLSTNLNHSGGGLVVSGGTNRATVYDNLIYDNISTTVGSLHGLQVFNAATAKIYNNTFHGNGNGTGNWAGALFAQKTTTATATFGNNIIYNNNGKDIVDDPAAPMGADLTLTTNLLTDPTFVNAAAKDFHLQAGSAAIDVGTAFVEVANDYDAISRPQGSAYDIGAFEYVAPAVPIFSSVYVGMKSWFYQ